MPFDFSTTNKPLKIFSMAGLTDIVLLLLIFFLLTSNFIPQFGIQVTLPEVSTSMPSQDPYVTVAINAEGRFFVGQEEVSQENLLASIREAQGERTAIVLRADQQATVGDFAAVAGAARALNMRVLMATNRADLAPAVE